MVTYNQSGYIGCSMSERAREAYEDGEKPKSRWTKSVMLEAIESYAEENDIALPDDLYHLSKAQLFEGFFIRSSWHHTSVGLHETDFYSLSEDAMEDPSSTIDSIDRSRPKKTKADDTLHYATITYEEWKGTRRYGGYCRYVRPCIVKGNWAYTTCNKKRLDGIHVLNIKYYDEMPEESQASYKAIERKLVH